MIYVISNDAKLQADAQKNDLNNQTLPSLSRDVSRRTTRKYDIFCKRGFLIALAVTSMTVACVCGVLLVIKFNLWDTATDALRDSRISIIDTLFPSNVNGM
jgi:hypothetical protein